MKKPRFKVGREVWVRGVIAASYGQFSKDTAVVRFTDKEDSDSAHCAQAAEVYHKDIRFRRGTSAEEKK